MIKDKRAKTKDGVASKSLFFVLYALFYFEDLEDLEDWQTSRLRRLH